MSRVQNSQVLITRLSRDQSEIYWPPTQAFLGELVFLPETALEKSLAPRVLAGKLLAGLLLAVKLLVTSSPVRNEIRPIRMRHL